jgi:hypothetical protein
MMRDRINAGIASTTVNATTDCLFTQAPPESICRRD